MRTALKFGSVGILAAALAVVFSSKIHIHPGFAVIPDEQRIPQRKDKRGKRMTARCTKSERMRQMALKSRTIFIRAG